MRLWIGLAEDPSDEIRTAAAQSLETLEASGVQELLADEECSAEVLAHYAPQAARDEALAERVAFHARAPAAALAVLASTGSPAVVDLVMTNEERLLANPTL
ncbi:MAG: hypothetical protein GWO04_10620, partial [Actinobacteria bacterium]|nr:hypothetical protein [Actinomycetota bacterium]NIW27408.1 hypothetical protein [Actinomycetota bacterium]